jgi:hypothetical protein
MEFPSFNARTGSWLDIATALKSSAAVVVREAFDPEMLKRMREKVGRQFDAADKAQLAQLAPGQSLNGRRQSVSVLADNIVLPEGAAPQLLRHPLFTGVANLLLKAESTTRFAYFRRMSADEPHLALPFHQDQTVIAAVWDNEEHRNDLLMNAWVPLDDSGDDRPGLELLTELLDEIITPSEKTNNILGQVGTEISEAEIFNRFSADSFSTPITHRGDVILFHGTTLHRTKLRPNMTGDRISVDVRFMAALEYE